MTDVGRMLDPWVDDQREYAFLIGLEGDDQVAFILRVATGGVDQVVVPLNRFIGEAVMLGYQRIMLAHTHPASTTTVSHDDKWLTLAALRAAEAVGLVLVDHIIVTADHRTVSLVEQGVLAAEEVSV